jgi:hypothetical protein
VALTLALNALAGLWKNVLQPALEDVWEFVDLHLMPIFEDIRDFIATHLAPAIQTFVDGALSTAYDVFLNVRDAVQWVIDKIQILIDKLKGVELPEWLQEHSPSPFEHALRGIGDAMDTLARKKLPALQAGLSFDVDRMVGFDRLASTSSATGTLLQTERAQNFVDVHVYIDGRELRDGVISETVERGRLGRLGKTGGRRG